MTAYTVEQWVAQGNTITTIAPAKPKLVGSLGKHLELELIEGEKSLEQLLTVFEDEKQLKKAIASAEKMGHEIYCYSLHGTTIYKLNTMPKPNKVEIKKDLAKSIKNYLAVCKAQGSYARYWGYVDGLRESKKLNVMQYDMVMQWWEE